MAEPGTRPVQAEREDQQQSQIGKETARGARQGARATREGIRASGHAMRQGIEETGRAAEQAERIGTDIVAETTAMAQDLAQLAVLPQLATRSLQGAQEIVTCIMKRAVETNIHVAKELAGQTNPAAFFQLQQQIVRHFVRGMLDGGTEMARVSRRVMEDTLRPMEENLSYAGQVPSHARPHATVGDVMTRDVEIVNPDQPVQEAARLMDEADTGALPVGENDRLVGMITDRDIAVRVVGEGKNAGETRVRDVMTQDVKYCFEDEHIDHIARTMGEQQIRRLPVMNRDKRLVGIISLGDISTRHSPERAGQALSRVSQPGDLVSGSDIRSSADAGRAR